MQESLREVYRTLRPGGKFFATTFEIGAFGGAARNNSFRWEEWWVMALLRQ